MDILYIAIDYLDIESNSFAPTAFTCRSQPATETIPQHTEQPFEHCVCTDNVQ